MGNARLAPIAPYLSPAPQIQTIRYTGSRLADGVSGPVDVLVVAIARAPALVPCTVGGQAVFYLRIGDSTTEPPPYLITDLMVGHRRRPILTARDFSVFFPRAVVKDEEWTAVHRVRFAWAVDNESFVLARHLRAGVIAWTTYAGAAGTEPSEPPRFVRNWIDVREPPAALTYDPSWDARRWRLSHLKAQETEAGGEPTVDGLLHPFVTRTTTSRSTCPRVATPVDPVMPHRLALRCTSNQKMPSRGGHRRDSRTRQWTSSRARTRTYAGRSPSPSSRALSTHRW